MSFSPPPPLSLLTCSQCHGGGYVGIRPCPTCRGVNMGHEQRGKFLYFGAPLTRYHIALRKARRIMNQMEIFGAIIFALGFLGFFVFFIMKKSLDTAIWDVMFWLPKTPPNGRHLFWLSLVSFCYLIYRVIATTKPYDRVEAHPFHTGLLPTGYGQHSVASWTDVRQIHYWKKKDISRVFAHEALLVLEQAFALADKYRSDVLPEHVFYALLSSERASIVFIRLGLSRKVIQAKLAQSFSKSSVKKMPAISPAVAQIIFQAYEEAYESRLDFVHVTELLATTMKQSEVLQELLYDFAVDNTKLENATEWLRMRERLSDQYRRFRRAAVKRSKYGIDRAMTAVATPYLNSFSQDLTLAAKYGYVSPCVARDKEIDETYRIIEGGRQNVLLVGEQGVGKMSIIEGMTERMVKDEGPKRLHDKRLVQLSTSSLLAGTTVSGAQERLIRMMQEIARAGNVILFINNIHDLMSSVGAGGQGLDVSGTLAEYLSSNRFLTLATTTLEEYNRYILQSPLSTVFARIDINEMNDNQAIHVLESKVGAIEYKHQVFFSYDALSACVQLAHKFLHDERLPENAVQVMSEVATYVRSTKGENKLVTAEDVAHVISEKTGIPMTSISEDESTKLLRLEEEMYTRVIGQDEAVSVIANALRRARAEIRSVKRPIANFLFLGPTGVGKTELAKTIAEVYFGGEQRMIRIDMSEFQDKSAIYRLIGQPGQKGTGLLTEAVRQHPFSLVLLDEMEKADPDVLNLFLQVFDDGRLTDSVGRVIDFTNTIIIATSNAATSYVQAQIALGVSFETIRQALIHTELKPYYRPEFLNRFDGIVLFKSLTHEHIKRIAAIMLQQVAKDLDKRGVGLQVNDAALESLTVAGFDPEFGARPMRRTIQEKIENPIAELIVGGKLERRDTVVIEGDCGVRVESGSRGR